MKLRHWTRNDGWPLLSLMALVVATIGSAAARAQSTESGGAPTASVGLGEIVVTGTRIRGVAATGSQTIAIGRDDMAASGLPVSSDLARALPQVINLGADESRLSGAQDAAANTTRISGINLRGIGSEATLLLLNGRRIAPAGVIKAAFDPNVIPAAAVERMEVLVDGASAIYGSDAVAGVVNIVTRRDFSGAETTVRYGAADGLDQTILSQTFGSAWEGGSIFAAMELYDRGRLDARDRPFVTQDRRARGGSDARSTLASPGNIVSGTTRYPLPPGDGTNLDPAQLVAGAPNLFDQGLFGDLLPSQERKTAFVDARHHFGRLELFYQGFYTERDFDEFVPPASGALRVPRSNAFFTAPAALGTPATVTVEYRFLAEDADARLIGFENAWQNAIGGSFDLGRDWQLGAYASLSQNRGFQSRGAITNGAALTAALASSNPATAFNPFGDGSWNVSNNPALVDIIIANRDTSATSQSDDYVIHTDGPLFDLPGGPVRLAAGVEHHEQSFRQRLDATNVLPDGSVQTKRVNNARDYKSYYAELFVPLVNREQGRAGLHHLDLSVAGRHEDYSDWGTTTNPKFGLSWGITGAFALRASYGESFRAPSLVDTSEQIHNIFIMNLTDPTSPTGVRRGIFHNGGRSTLQPEEAETWSVGFDLRPTGALDGLTLSATYYSVDYDGRIDVVPASGLTAESVYAPYIIRRPDPTDAAATAAFNAMLQDFLASTDLQSPVEPVTNLHVILDGRRANLGVLKQRGIDVGAAYSFDSAIGRWRLGVDAARILELKRAIAPGAAPIDVNDTFGNPVDLRLRGSLGWNHRNWQANLFVNHVDGYTNTAVNPNVEVASHTTVDVSASYEFEDAPGPLQGVSLAFSVQDLFDRDPPIVLNGTVSWDNQNVSAIGRMASFWVTKRW